MTKNSVSFAIAPSYISTFLKGRHNSGGVLVAAKNLSSGECGMLYICHHGSLDIEKVKKARWIISCYLPFELCSFCPFQVGGTNIIFTQFIKETNVFVCEMSQVDNKSGLQADLDYIFN